VMMVCILQCRRTARTEVVIDSLELPPIVELDLQRLNLASDHY
jgi:hypothetical protein